MSVYCAEIIDGTVTRVVIAPSLDWCSEHLGGQWVETADPYDPADDRVYCGPGWGHDDRHPQRFAPAWDKTDTPGDGQLVWHDGRIEPAADLKARVRGDQPPTKG